MSFIYNWPNIYSEFKYSIRIALPLIASEMIYALNGFIATVMISHLSKEQLAANALVWSIYVAMLLFFIGILCSTSIMVAQSFGAKDNNGISMCFKQGLLLAVFSSVPMMLLLWQIPGVLELIKQDPVVIKCAKPFFYSLIWSMLPLNVWVICQQFLIGINKTSLVVFTSIIAVPIELFFYYAFLFGKFGFPKLGLDGIGNGLGISYCVGALFLLVYLLCSKQIKFYALFKKWWVIESRFLLEMVRIGLPMGLMWCSEVLFFAVVAIMMGILGTTVLAAYQISYQYMMIALVILFALNQSVAVRVGNEVGRNDRNQLKLTIAVNMGIGFILLAVFSIFYLLFPEVAVGVDIDVKTIDFKGVFVQAVKFFPIVAVLLMTDCLRIISAGALRGLKDSNLLMFISMFGFWLIAFPCSYLLAFKFGFGGAGIWWGIVIGLFVTGVMFLGRFYYLVNKVDLIALVTK